MKMSIFTNIRKTFQDTLNIYKQMRLDRILFRRYKELLEDEFSKRESEFVKIGLKLAEDRETLSYTFRIPEEFQTSGQDWMIMDKLNENTYFITEFLKTKAGFQNYITPVPEFYHVEDPNSTDLSLTYIAFWTFNPMIDKELRIKAVSGLIGAALLFIGIGTGIWFLI